MKRQCSKKLRIGKLFEQEFFEDDSAPTEAPAQSPDTTSIPDPTPVLATCDDEKGSQLQLELPKAVKPKREIDLSQYTEEALHKKRLARDLSRAVSQIDLNDDKEIDFKIVVPSDGKGSHVTAGTRIVREMAKMRPNDHSKINKQDSNSSGKKKKIYTRASLQQHLTRKARKETSKDLTYHDINQAFKTTSLEELEEIKNRNVERRTKMREEEERREMERVKLQPRRKTEPCLRRETSISSKEGKVECEKNGSKQSAKESSTQVKSESGSKMTVLSSSNLTSLESIPHEHKPSFKRMKSQKQIRLQEKRQQTNKYKCDYLEYEAEKQDSDQDSDYLSDQEENTKDLEDLINNNPIPTNQKVEREGYAKANEILDQKHEKRMERVMKDRIFMRREIPKDKLDMLRQQQKFRQNENYAVRVQRILRASTAEEQEDILPLWPPRGIDHLTEEEKQALILKEEEEEKEQMAAMQKLLEAAQPKPKIVPTERLPYPEILKNADKRRVSRSPPKPSTIFDDMFPKHHARRGSFLPPLGTPKPKDFQSSEMFKSNANEFAVCQKTTRRDAGIFHYFRPIEKENGGRSE